MRPTANFTIHAILAACLAAFATTSAAAADIYLKIEGHKGEGKEGLAGGGQIEVDSFQWGPRQTTSADGSRTRTGNMISLDDTAGREKLQPGGGGAGAAQKDMVMKGSKIGENAPHGRWVTITERPSLATETAAAAERRQHEPVKIIKQYEAGRLAMRGSLPGCTIGTSYPAAVMQTAAARFELKQVVVSGCASDSVTLDYGKVIVRAWDPQKKESIVGQAQPR